MVEHVMTMAEILEVFHGEWVLLQDPEVDEQGWVVGGQVTFHGPDRAAVFREAARLPPPRRFAVRFAGQAPTGRDFLL